MKKKIIAVFSVFIAIILVLVIIVYNNSYKNDVYVENKTNNKNQVPGLISLMLETKAGSGIYNVSPDGIVPAKGYELNTEKSGCENGGTITYNETTKKFILKSNISTKCYAYFDVMPPDVTLSITNRPTTYGKLGSINCTNSNASYNQKYNRVEISSIDKKYTSCTLNYTDSTSKTNLATYIIGLSGTTQGTGQVVNEKGYRYEGKNPNNYVWFNNEYWRIIGVFDNTSHGQSGKNLVKIIREELLSGLAFDKNNSSNWTTSSLRSLLNENYYNATNGTESGYCYNYSNVITNNCNYTKIGIQDKYRKMIANVTWYLGGHTTYNVTTDALYGYERGSNVVSPAPTSTTGYIGLMYPSDYGYSALASSCARTTNVSSYRSNNCSGSSWLYGKGIEWTITPGGTANYVYYIDNYGFVDRYYAIYGNGIRPVVYLDSTVYKVSGTGSIDSPYIIGM